MKCCYIYQNHEKPNAPVKIVAREFDRGTRGRLLGTGGRGTILLWKSCCVSTRKIRGAVCSVDCTLKVMGREKTVCAMGGCRVPDTGRARAWRCRAPPQSQPGRPMQTESQVPPGVTRYGQFHGTPLECSVKGAGKRKKSGQGLEVVLGSLGGSPGFLGPLDRS